MSLETERQKYPTCPNCGEVYWDIYFEMDEEEECRKCGLVFTIETEEEVYYTTKIKKVNNAL